MSDFVLSEYQDAWPREFEQVAEQLRAILSLPTAVIEHIGSTSVPGLCAKPVLDLALGVSTLREVDAALPALAAAGFLYRPEYESTIPDRRYFVRPKDQTLRVHLHAVLLHGALWQQHISFRDQLRSDAQLREAYSDLKRSLAVAHAGNKVAYTEAKSPFIRKVLASRPNHTTGALDGAV
jgi:GrpB-like predicted nucleotidyltransferase (UPF0157 family)